MPFTRVNPGDLIQAQNLNQVIGSLNGTSGQGVPVAQTSVNDATNYALSVQNLEATNSRALNVLNSAGGLLIRADVNGVNLGNTTITGPTLTLPAGSVPNAALGPDVARANLLTNGGFEIWQRGTSFAAAAPGAAFQADRWQISGAGTGTLQLSKDTTNQDTGSGACCAATYAHVAGALLVVAQPLPSAEYPQLKGRAASFSMRVRTSVANMVRVAIYDGSAWNYSPYHNGNGTYQTLTVSNITLAAGASAWQVGAWWDNAISGLAYLDNAMLVVGSQPANYAPPHPADDVARCLRYYEWIPGPNEGGYLTVLQCFSATGANGAIRIRAPKAATPTFTVTSVGSFTCQLAAGGGTACTAINTASSTSNSMALTVTVASGLVAGNATMLNMASGNG